MLTACFIVLRHARAGGPQCKISMPMLRAEAVHPLTPQDLANAVLTTYFVVLGTLALTATVLPAVEVVLPEAQRQRVLLAYKGLRVPVLMKVRQEFLEYFTPSSFPYICAGGGCAAGGPATAGAARFQGPARPRAHEGSMVT